MRLFSNMPISRKLLTVFSIMVLINVAVGTVTYQKVSFLRNAAGWTSHTHEVLARLDALVAAMVDQETGVRGYIISGDEKFLEPYRKGGDAFQNADRQVRALTADNAGQQRRLDEVGSLQAQWRREVTEKEIALMGHPETREAARGIVSSGAGKVMMDGIRAKVAEMQVEENSLLGVRELLQQDAFSITMLFAILGALLPLAVAVLGGLLLRGTVARPISGMTSAMSGLAAGDTSVTVPGVGRRDEIGAMAEAVEVFKQNAITRVRLEAEQREQAAKAEQEKSIALMHMAETIERETSGALDTVAERTSAIATAAQEMSDSAARTGGAAHAAATAAAQALATAQTVASAAEQLASSVREIGSQVNLSTAVVGRAVQAGGDARSTMSTLTDRVERIGVVADMIAEIAAKTNLLALNATIEAARAGDAGKGFAVVASEVKQLATQTARSTQDITRHIGEVRAAATASVSTVERIEATIGEISAISHSIAAAIEEQTAATAEIARNVNETATAANEITRRINDVSTEAQHTGQRSGQVRDDTVTLNATAGELKQAVVRVVRSSTAEVDRRGGPRYPVALNCRVTLPGTGTVEAVTKDLSEGGAAIIGGPAMQVGARGMLEIAEVNVPLPFSVRAVNGETANVGFDLDQATREKLAQTLSRLSQKPAA
jgi:methyl-accepting chemotaxis protein